jgi:hypothetical protein
METVNAQTWTILVDVLVLALSASTEWFFCQKKRLHRLQRRFVRNMAEPWMSEAKQTPSRNSRRLKNVLSASIS